MARKTQSLDKAQEPQQQRHPTNDAKKPSEDLIAVSKVVTSKVQPGPNEEQHRAAERYYWRRELRILWWLNCITAIAVVGGIVSLIYIKRTLDVTLVAADAARVQAETAMKQLELSERPWVTADVRLTCPFEMGRWVCIEVSVENIGHSVAMQVSVEAKVVLSENPDAFMKRITSEVKTQSDVETQSELSCGIAVRFGSINGVGQIVLFPNQKGTIQIPGGVSIYAGKIEEKIFELSPELGALVEPIVVGCVIYRSTISQWNYRTGFAYQISSIRHPEGYVAMNEVHPVEDIRLKPRPYEEAYGHID